MIQIARNLEGILEAMASVAIHAGRSPDSVRLVAVSKRVDIKRILAAYAAGQRDFGENYVQEWRTKRKELPNDINWHYIGACQSNKAKYLVGQTALIHSVDRLSLLAEIDKQARRRCGEERVGVLIEVNVGDESTKAGVALTDLDKVVDRCCRLPGIRLCGLMSLPPTGEDPETSRPYHRLLADHFKRTKERLERDGFDEVATHFNELSMGTSVDFRVAVEEGATIVRVGTAVFGPRK